MARKYEKRRVKILEEMGEEEVFRLYAEVGSLKKLAARLFEPHPDFPDAQPGYTAFYAWLDKEDGRRARWKKYKSLLGDIAAEEAVEIAMNATQEDWQVARLKVDTKKWQAGILNREEYGDQADRVVQSFGRGLMQALLEADKLRPDKSLPSVTPENVSEAEWEVEE